MRLSNTFFFVHIPKTAGTSFRFAAQHYFGIEHLHLDYGPDATQTSPLVKHKVYSGHDLFGLSLSLSKQKCKFFGGHVPVMRYAPLFYARNIISFVRDPVMQLLSHYEHLVLKDGYTKSLDEYLVDPAKKNDRPHVYLHGIPLEVCGFIGVTERYAESLTLFNKTYGTEFTLLNMNANKRNGVNKYKAYAQSIAKIPAFVAHEMPIYEKANRLLDERLRAQAGGWNYVHGAIQTVNSQVASGFAFWSSQSTKPVRVQLWINDKLLGVVAAMELRPLLRNFNVPRNGFVGFSFSVANSLNPGDRIRCSVEETGQSLGEVVFTPQPIGGVIPA